jgi:lysophospholipase L1-like esterase
MEMKMRYTHVLAAALLVVGLVSTATAQPRSTDPARWADAVAAFDADAPSRPEGAIVLTGSSSFARWRTMEADLAPLTVVPRGFGGSTMADVLHYVDRLVMPYNPRAVVIYEGDNDTFYGVAPSTIAGELKQIITKIHTALPDTRVYVLSVKPSLARVSVWDKAQEATALFEGITASDERLHFIDVATPFLKADGKVMDDVFVDDGLHLNDKGNAIWAKAIKAVLMDLEGEFEMRKASGQ